MNTDTATLEEELEVIYCELKLHEEAYFKERDRVIESQKEAIEELYKKKKRIEILEAMLTNKQQELNALNL